ncbi:RidA family protein [Anaerovoracaceae bacterium 41-7]|uniref:RidA family protein n=1 Tax=Anaerotruncus colihominis TaxID=169435 RepID=A0A845QGH7_9FIRM|nr:MULTISPECIES: RidA family protein [Clostridia]NBH60486.1 RidA family protein [Anaerotruncus colihominis]NCE97691.1 RidA family protein [Emergencia sp. 1XD21-10]NCF01140.1 RidA family protein [Anaerotruncus sp. 80]
MIAEKRIEELGIELPLASPPGAMYIPVKQLGNALFVAGQVPFVDGKLLVSGKVGDTVSMEQAEEAARRCIINLMAALKDYLGDLDKVKNITKIQVFVNSKTGFMQQHLVANAASQLLYDVFGEKGRHARTAVGTNQLPMDAPVEIEAIVEV